MSGACGRAGDDLTTGRYSVELGSWCFRDEWAVEQVHGDASLITWGRSEFLRREAAFVALVAAGLAVLQLILWMVGVADDLVTPFGLIVPFALAIAGLLAAMGTHQPRCRTCDHGLEVNRFLTIAATGLPAARAVLEVTDGRALAGLVLPEGGSSPRRHLRVRDCPVWGRSPSSASSASA